MSWQTLGTWVTLSAMSTQAQDVQPIPVDTFEIRLAIARAHAGGLSAEKAALLVGVSGQTWRNWEDGTSPGAKHPAMLHYIAQRLKVNEEWLKKGGALRSPGDGPDDGGPATFTYPYSVGFPGYLPDLTAVA